MHKKLTDIRAASGLPPQTTKVKVKSDASSTKRKQKEWFQYTNEREMTTVITLTAQTLNDMVTQPDQ